VLGLNNAEASNALARAVFLCRLGEIWGRSLRIVDGSTMPRVATGQTMGPCIIIGERAGEMLRNAYKI
jgi:hypothetical protein